MNQQKKNDEKSLQNLLEVAASLPNTLNIESTESTGIVTPEPLGDVPPFEDILPDRSLQVIRDVCCHKELHKTITDVNNHRFPPPFLFY